MATVGAMIITRAESFVGIRAGIASFEDVLRTPSHRTVENGDGCPSLAKEGGATAWPSGAGAVLILGLHHPEDDPGLDWWDGGNTEGNRRLMLVASALQRWLEQEQGIRALPLPYSVAAGGLFLKDAAVLSGLGVVGRNNLLIDPEWGPRVRLRALLIDGELESTGPLGGFSPCDTCGRACHGACPINAFATGSLDRQACKDQVTVGLVDPTPDRAGEPVEICGSPIKCCRACELACPVGAGCCS